MTADRPLTEHGYIELSGGELSGSERELRLPDGRKILLRPIKPSDARLYKDYITNVSPEDMRLRFFGSMRELSPALVAQLTQPDDKTHTAIVAVDTAASTLLGVARFAVDNDQHSAEFAVLVRSGLHGLGLGWQLMRYLIHRARACGIDELYGHVLRDNIPMLTMASELGFRLEPSREGQDIVRATLKLALA